MKTYERNVRLDGHIDRNGRKRGFLERVLLANKYVNKTLSWTAQLTLTALIWPRFVAPFKWELTRHTLDLGGLSPAFNGYRILQLSDLHVGQARMSYLARVVEGALLEKPD